MSEGSGHEGLDNRSLGAEVSQPRESSNGHNRRDSALVLRGSLLEHQMKLPSLNDKRPAKAGRLRRR